MTKNATKFWPKIGALENFWSFGVVWGYFEISGVVLSILEKPDEVEIG